MTLTISEAITTMKLLQSRHAELVSLRNSNASQRNRMYGNDREVREEVLYDSKALDRLVTGVAREIRLLDMALKRANAATFVAGYDWNEKVLGELS